MTVILQAMADHRWVSTGLALGIAYFIVQPDPRKLLLPRWRRRDNRE